MPPIIVRSLLTGRVSSITLGRGTARIHDVVDRAIETDEGAIPGVFDMQVNGAGPYDLNSPDVTSADVAELAQLQWKFGTTQFCPTIVTGPKDRLLHSLETVAKARSEDSLLAHAMPFIHVEGPHISILDGPRGAHDPAYVRPPDLSEFDEWQRVARGAIKMVTLAPELPGALDYVKGLKRRGVVAAIGHTAATPEDVRRAISAGARCATHLGNGCEAVLPRHPNRLWTQLADKRLWATFIADGHHLDDDTLSAMVNAKGIYRSILVSDSVATPDLPLDAVGQPRRLELHGTPYLAGGSAPLLLCLMALVGGEGLNWGQAERLPLVIHDDYWPATLSRPTRSSSQI